MITIYKNQDGDSRTASINTTFEDFQDANDQHINDVDMVMSALSDMVMNAGSNHDCTKKVHERLFYKEMIDSMVSATDFTTMSWYKLHCEAERHHLNAHIPDDVNLIDVLEMISDCVCAGLARNGEVRQIDIPDEVLKKAVKNTISLVKSMVRLEDCR